MWNNKLDNIYVYHRPKASSDPSNPECEFHALKIKKQKQVGKKGTSIFSFDWKKRRFLFNETDQLSYILVMKKINFEPENPFM